MVNLLRTFSTTQVHLFKLEQELRKKYKNLDLCHFYMVGDNPPVDIKGANDSGLTSILVKTGVFEGEINDKLNPAKHVVNNALDAVNLVFNLESLC
jgi:ribonucleotide monophosphatase NagD (HAD superfamily)